MHHFRSLLVIVLCWFVVGTTARHRKLNPPLDVNRFVENCFYKIGEKQWKKDHRHECHKLTDVIKSDRPFSIYEPQAFKAYVSLAQSFEMILAYRRLLKLKAEDEQIALECL